MLYGSQRKRPIAFLLIAATLLCFSASGCAHDQKIDTDIPDDSYRAIEDELASKNVRISLGSGTTPEGSSLRLDADMTTWTDEETGEKTSVPTPEVWRLLPLRGGIVETKRMVLLT